MQRVGGGRRQSRRVIRNATWRKYKPAKKRGRGKDATVTLFVWPVAFSDRPEPERARELRQQIKAFARERRNGVVSIQPGSKLPLRVTASLQTMQAIRALSGVIASDNAVPSADPSEPFVFVA